MLCINRYVDQEITLDFSQCTPADIRELKKGPIRLRLIRGWRDGAKIGIEAPTCVTILRDELTANPNIKACKKCGQRFDHERFGTQGCPVCFAEKYR